MVDWKGAQTIAAMKYAGGGSWMDGTDIACAALSAFEFESESIPADAQFIPNTGISGNVAQRQGCKGNESHIGDLVLPANYENIDLFLVPVLGTAGARGAAGTGFSGISTPKVNLAGIHKTIVFGHTSAYVRVYDHVKFVGFTLNWTQGEQMKATINCVADQLTVDDSAVNKLATLTNITRTTEMEPIEFNHLEVVLNPQGSGTITDFNAGAMIHLSALSLTVNNNMRAPSVTTQFAPYTDEPQRHGWMAVTGTLTWGELDSKQHQERNISKAPMKMAFRCRGDADTFGAGIPRTLQFEFGSVQFESHDEAIGGPEMAPNVVNFSCSSPLAAPAGMTGTDIIKMRHVSGLERDSITEA